VQLQNSRPRFEAKGIKLAAISYDSPAILKEFADRHKIDFPLLADPHSEVIRSFHVLNTQAKGMTLGMAYPGFFYLDTDGRVRERYFEAKYTERFTPGNVLGKLFPELTAELTQNVEAPHLRLALGQSDAAIVSGRVNLSVEIELPHDVHVYAPGVSGYKPIQLMLSPTHGIEFRPAIYPTAKTLYLEAIKEQVPVFDGKFRITEDVVVPFSKVRDGLRSLLSGETTLTIAGNLIYQACDKTTCYPPNSVPLKWTLRLIQLDLKRSSDRIQHKAPAQ